MKGKILYFHHSGLLGGAPRSLFFLLQSLKREKYNAEVIGISEGPAVSLLESSSVKVHVEPKIYPFHGSTVVPKGSLYILFVNLFLWPLTIFYARKHIKKRRPQILHLNSSCLCFVALAAKSVDSNIKIVCHVREPLRKSFFGNIIKIICSRYVDHFISIDSFSGDSMSLSDNKNTTIYNSVDLELYNNKIKSNVLRDELDLKDENTKIFLYLARIAPGNGALELVRMAKKVRSLNSSIQFVIVGLPEDKRDSYINQVLEESHFDDGIHIMQFRSDIPNVIASSDIMIVPFTEPHFARSIIEASAMGVPSIGANIQGVDELVINGKTGLLYDNEEQFTQHCLSLAEDIERRNQMKEECLIHARANFDNNVNSLRVFSIYDKLLN